MRHQTITIALAMLASTVALGANDDIAKALQQIDEEQARIFKLKFEEAKRECNERARCIKYEFLLEEAKQRLLRQQRDESRDR